MPQPVKAALRVLAGEEGDGAEFAAFLLLLLCLEPRLLSPALLFQLPGPAAFLSLPRPCLRKLRRLFKDPGAVLLLPDHQHCRLMLADLCGMVPPVLPPEILPLGKTAAIEFLVIPVVIDRFGCRKRDIKKLAVSIPDLRACGVGCGDQLLNMAAFCDLFRFGEQVKGEQPAPFLLLLHGFRVVWHFYDLISYASLKTILPGIQKAVNRKNKLHPPEREGE